MRETSLQCLIFVMSLLCCKTNQARVAVSSSKFQVFQGDVVSLNCEEDNTAAWTLRRNTSGARRSQCGSGWGKLSGSSCIIPGLLLLDSGVYWCESTNGSTSNNITLTVNPGGAEILQPPFLPGVGGPTPPPVPTSTSWPAASSPSNENVTTWWSVLLICALLVLVVLLVLLLRRLIRRKAYEVNANKSGGREVRTQPNPPEQGPMRPNNETEPADDPTAAQVEIRPLSNRELPPLPEVVYSVPKSTPIPSRLQSN